MSHNQLPAKRLPARTNQPAHQARWQDHLRIAMAIAGKDILEAIKNKSTLTMMISSMFVVLMYWALPWLESGVEQTSVLIYDAGNSSLVPLLENQGTYRIRTYDSDAQMLRTLAAGDRPEIGLSIPADFDQVLQAGSTPQLQGYRMNWISDKQAQELKQGFEAEIRTLYGRSIPLLTEGNTIFMRPDVRGAGVQAAMSASFLLVMIGLTLVAHLMMEEKQNKTIQAILVSPAASGDFVAGKALTGLFYCLLGGGIALAINANLVVHWGYALLVMLVGSLFVVSLGLCMGSFIENPAQLTLWSWVWILPLIAPIMIVLLDDLFPARIVQVVHWFPTAILLDQFQAAFSGSFPLGAGLLQLAWILAWTLVILFVVAWIVRLSDREKAIHLPHFGQQATHSPVPLGTKASNTEMPVISSSLMENGTIPPSGQPAPNQAPRRVTGWGLIWAIAWKDIREAIRNKLVISILVGIAFMMLSSLAIPMLLNSQAKPAAVIYDPSRSTAVAALSGRDDLRLVGVDSLEAMSNQLTRFPTPMLGLVLPPDFDQLVGRSETIHLEGYVAHWTSPAEAQRLAASFSEQLSRAGWGAVEITISDQREYPRLEQPFILNFVQIIGILTIGITLVPFLFVEEKETHTMDALLVSPVSIRQVVVGKALAGLFYCGLAAAVILAFNAYSIAHWWVALLAALLTGAFAVSIGLLIGAFADHPTTAGMGGGLLLLTLIALVLGSAFSQPGWPHWLQTVLDWSPVSLMNRLFGLAMVGDLPLNQLSAAAAGLLAATAISLALVVWRLARGDQ